MIVRQLQGQLGTLQRSLFPVQPMRPAQSPDGTPMTPHTAGNLARAVPQQSQQAYFPQHTVGQNVSRHDGLLCRHPAMARTPIEFAGASGVIFP